MLAAFTCRIVCFIFFASCTYNQALNNETNPSFSFPSIRCLCSLSPLTETPGPLNPYKAGHIAFTDSVATAPTHPNTQTHIPYRLP